MRSLLDCSTMVEQYSKVPPDARCEHPDRSEPPAPVLNKFDYPDNTDFETEFTLDPRLERRPSEKLIAKPYDSAFKGTNLGQMLNILGVDTLIVTGCSTCHCVYATCRYAVEAFHLIVPAEAVGERCEIMHEVNPLDIDISMGDVLSVDEVVGQIGEISSPIYPGLQVMVGRGGPTDVASRYGCGKALTRSGWRCLHATGTGLTRGVLGASGFGDVRRGCARDRNSMKRRVHCFGRCNNRPTLRIE